MIVLYKYNDTNMNKMNFETIFSYLENETSGSKLFCFSLHDITILLCSFHNFFCISAKIMNSVIHLIINYLNKHKNSLNYLQIKYNSIMDYL